MLACESSSAFLRRFALFAVTGDEVHPTARNSLIVLADPCSAYSAKGGLGRAQLMSHGASIFPGFHAFFVTCFLFL